MLHNIRKLFRETSIYDFLYISLIISSLILLTFWIITLQVDYFQVINVPYFTYIVLFLSSFLFLFVIFSIFKPKLYVSKNKRLVLVLEVIFVFLIAYVIL